MTQLKHAHASMQVTSSCVEICMYKRIPMLKSYDKNSESSIPSLQSWSLRVSGRPEQNIHLGVNLQYRTHEIHDVLDLAP